MRALSSGCRQWTKQREIWISLLMKDTPRDRTTAHTTRQSPRPWIRVQLFIQANVLQRVPAAVQYGASVNTMRSAGRIIALSVDGHLPLTDNIYVDM